MLVCPEGLWTSDHNPTRILQLLALSLSVLQYSAAKTSASGIFWLGYSLCRLLVDPVGTLIFYLIYHCRALSRKVVSNCAILTTSSVILFTVQIASQVNQCCSASSFPVPECGSCCLSSSVSSLHLLWHTWHNSQLNGGKMSTLSLELGGESFRF
jgi:hypothetical protein